MNLNSFKTNHSDELIVRGAYKSLLLYAILFTTFCLGGIIELCLTSPSALQNLSVNIIICIIFFISASFFWLKVYDNKIKMIINKRGIASKKFGLISWDDIWYFHIQEQFFKGHYYHYLILKSRQKKEYKIELSNYDKTYGKVKEAIFANSSNKSLIDLGIDIIK